MKRKEKRQKYLELCALKGRIRENKTSYRELSKNINISLSSLSNKINGFQLLNVEEIFKISKELNIGSESIQEYFFPQMMN